ncbi:hypothetical protein ACWCWQ_37195 [Streptomyces sp. NPDC001571]
MTVRDAVTCDKSACMAFYLEPVANPDTRPGLHPEPTRADDVLDFEQLVNLAGWEADDAAGHTCPACATGGGPVLELGECPRCGGRTADLEGGATCMYCKHVTPHPTDEEW